jgi:ketosteroid isomerase-like protein
MDVSDAFDGVRFDVQEVEGIDDERAVSAQRLVGTFRLTGIKLNHLWGSVVSVRDGKILSAVRYMSREEGRPVRAASPRRTEPLLA